MTLPPIPRSCSLCDLCSSRTQVVLPTPCKPGGLLAIGEAPGADEDIAGEGFVGRAGKVLDSLLVKNGLRRRDEYGVANIARCRPPANRKPTTAEIAACLPQLAVAIATIRPRVLLLVGGTAAQVFLGRRPMAELAQASHRLGTDVHPALRAMLGAIDAETQVVASPHTSALAWNRFAPDGQRWSEIGARQVALAASLIRVR